MAAITRLSAFGYGTRRTGTFLRPVAPSTGEAYSRLALVEALVTGVSVEEAAVTAVVIAINEEIVTIVTVTEDT